jgi:hypothetical protein
MQVNTRTTQWTQYKDLVAHYRSDAERSASVRAYSAACVMLGATLESALLLMGKLFEGRLASDGMVPRNEDGEERPDPAEWTLQETLAVARQAGWLPATFSSLKGFDPITLISCGLPEAHELADETTWHREMLQPAKFAQYHRSVSEDVYDSCRNYVADTLRALAEHLKREVAQDGDDEEFAQDAKTLCALFEAQGHLLQQNHVHDDCAEVDAIIL